MMWLFYMLLFVFGLALGSFFNVLILRYDTKGRLFSFKKLSGRSHCPHCLTILKPSELIPLFSFFWQRGKCKNCGGKISWFYPLTEFLTGIVFAGVPYFLNNFYKVSEIYFWAGEAPLWFYFLIFIWFLITLVFLLIVLFDIRYYLIPNELNFILFVLGVIISLLLFYNAKSIFPFRTSFLKNYALLFPWSENILASHLSGAFLAGAFFLLLVLLSKGKGIGVGDVKLAFSSGAVLGLPDISLTVILSFILGGIVGVLGLLLGKKGLKDKIPFAPIFISGILIVAFWGKELLDFYFGIFGI